MSVVETFEDHNGEKVPYQVKRGTGSENKFLCSIDPHECGEYAVMGNGLTRSAAIQNAKTEWCRYDTRA